MFAFRRASAEHAQFGEEKPQGVDDRKWRTQRKAGEDWAEYLNKYKNISMKTWKGLNNV